METTPGLWLFSALTYPWVAPILMPMSSKALPLIIGLIVLLGGAVFLLGRTLTRDPVVATLPGSGATPGTTQAPAAPSSQVDFHPSLTEALMAAGEMRHEDSIRLLLEVPEGHATYLLAQFNLGVIQEAHGNAAAAVEALRRVAALQDESAEVYAALGRAYSRAGDLDLAESATLRAIELEPGHLPARYHVGFVRTARGEIADAINAYRRAVASDAQGSHISLAQLDLIRLHAEQPELPATHYALAFMASALGAPDNEMTELDHFLALDPQGPARAKAQARREALKVADLPAQTD